MRNDLRYLCIFGGGAVRGYAYLGVLDAFKKNGFYPEKLAGSSVGAVFAAFCSLGMPLELIKEILMNINFELFKDINFSFAPTFSLSKGGVFLDWLRDNIEKFYYKDKYKKGKNPPVCFKDLDKDLYLIATDLTNYKPFVFCKEYTPDYEVAMAIRASASLPGLLSPIILGDKVLTDGDLMKSNPVWRLDKVLCPDELRILEFRLEGIYSDSNIKNMMDYFNRIHSYTTNYSTDFIIDMYGQRDKFDYIKINTNDLLLFNFNISDEDKFNIINIGYDTTMKFFNEDLPIKQKNILQDYLMIYDNLEVIDTQIKCCNIIKAKKALGDLIMHLSEIKKVIDKDIIKKIKIFRNVFYDNLTCKLFGGEKLLNNKKVQIEMTILKEVLRQKCKELS